MTWEIRRKTRRRFEEPGHARFLTFFCRDRKQLFDHPAIRDLLADQVIRSRSRLGFKLYGWVVMPEHVHLLVRTGSVELTIPMILMSIKRPVATRAMKALRERGGDVPDSFWQPGGGHDRNIYSRDEFEEKIEYIHRNPVARGLVEREEDWAWSSYRAWKKLDTPWPIIDRG